MSMKIAEKLNDSNLCKNVKRGEKAGSNPSE
jgi:hypothetical protein